ncbi:hypothetical protein [Corynebacterium phoceense]|uniref:hypothetical protein n=1 Tax=Corynebacterium phoceense TaxID=1686286 RepID=UPI00211C3ACF|nr:hypothetical protein [Corynebacterium phoceense]
MYRRSSPHVLLLNPLPHPLLLPPPRLLPSQASGSTTTTTTEMNLALTLGMMDCNAEFETVWGQGHSMAEVTGDGDSNFIEWVGSL